MPFVEWNDATSHAYRMASRWGGEFLVFSSSEPRQPFRVVADSPAALASAAAAGCSEIGRAVSREIGELSWRWASGSTHDAPPLSPFADLPHPVPARLVSHLEPATRVLHDWMSHVMALQERLRAHDMAGAWRLLADGFTPKQPHQPVSFESYLRLAGERGATASEIARLKGVLAAATEAVRAGDPFVAQDILMGRAVRDAGQAPLSRT
jgi:hypothetical protein